MSARLLASQSLAGPSDCLHLTTWLGVMVEKGGGEESWSPDLAYCPRRSRARFYYNPHILLQILNQLDPRLGWTLWCHSGL